MSDRHGYGPYTQGCRCETCKAAKREYMSRRRKAAFAAPQPMAEGVRHGRRSTYDEHGCRCAPCTEAKLVPERVRKYNRYWAAKAQERAS